MVRIRQGPFGEIPGFVPTQLCIIQQDSHQFGDCHRRVRVVQLDSNLLGESAPCRVGSAKAAYEVGPDARGQGIGRRDKVKTRGALRGKATINKTIQTSIRENTDQKRK